MDRLRHEVVGAGLERRHAILGVIERGDHHDGQVGGCGIRLDPATDLEPVHARHDRVDQDEIRLTLDDLGQRLGTVARRLASASAPSLAGMTSRYSEASCAWSRATEPDESSTTRTRALTIDCPGAGRRAAIRGRKRGMGTAIVARELDTGAGPVGESTDDLTIASDRSGSALRRPVVRRAVAGCARLAPMPHYDPR